MGNLENDYRDHSPEFAFQFFIILGKIVTLVIRATNLGTLHPLAKVEV
jgi:hypothetical protein